MNNIICLLCYLPNDIYCDFLNNFIKYKIYIIVDKNINLEKYKDKYRNIKFLKLNTDICISKNYINSCQEIYYHLPKSISWDKALYIFNEFKLDYDHIWFIEDDVFFHNENTLLTIDNKYGYCDLLTKEWLKDYKYDNNYSVWNYINMIGFDEPYYLTEIACCRLSNKFLKYIKNYVYEFNTLHCLEAFFPTLCIKNNLLLKEAKELNTIFYRKDFEKKDINHKNIYHPIKDKNKHLEFRS